MTLYDLIKDVRNRKSLDVLSKWCLLDGALAHSYIQTPKFSCLTKIPDQIFSYESLGLDFKKETFDFTSSPVNLFEIIWIYNSGIKATQEWTSPSFEADFQLSERFRVN